MSRHIKILVAATLAVLLTGVGIAVAAWRISGTGTGTGKAANAQGLTVTGATATADLYPGFSGGDVYVTVTNPNSFPVVLKTATITGPVTPDNCAVTVNTGPFTLTGTDAERTVAPNGETLPVTIPNALSMGLGADDSCQGAVVTVAGVTVTGDTPTS